MTPERLEELYYGCPACEGNVDDAPCLCPEPDEIRELVTAVRAARFCSSCDAGDHTAKLCQACGKVI